MGKCTCGTWNTDSAKFCRNCGKILIAPNSNSKIYSSSSRNNDKSSSLSINGNTLKQTQDTKGLINENSRSSGLSEGTKWIFTVILIIAGIALIAGGYSAPLAGACGFAIKTIWD